MQHRSFAVESFIRNKESFVTTRREFRAHFNLPPRAALPSNRSISKFVENFRPKGNVTPKKLSTRVPSVVTPENVNRVRESVEQSPRPSTRRRSQAFGISRTSLRRILKKNYIVIPIRLCSSRNSNLIIPFIACNLANACWIFFRMTRH